MAGDYRGYDGPFPPSNDLRMHRYFFRVFALDVASLDLPARFTANDALRAMHAAGTLKSADITVFLTGDEEDAGNPLSISRRDLIAEGKKADVALDFEDLSQEDAPNGPVDMGSIARRSAGSRIGVSTSCPVKSP